MLFATALPPAGWAASGSSFSVEISSSTSGSIISGVVRVVNDESHPLDLVEVVASLEIRFDDTATAPPLPPGSDSDWFTIAELELAVPAPVPAGGQLDLPFSIDACGTSAASYVGAKYMRAYGRATSGRLRDGYTPSFSLPPPCPICGNYVVESGEACDAGPTGGSCCTQSCAIRPNGSLCSDGDACTQVDQCQAGLCVGSSAVVCSAADQCHVAGTCNPATGVCSQPAKPDGALCTDENACTQGDSCQAGACQAGSPTICEASGTCMEASCDPASGACSETPLADGASCTDGDACTATDRCEAGICLGSDPVTCAASDSCHEAGTCDPATGACSDPPSPNNKPCDDGDACTSLDSCQAGACVGSAPVVCPDLGECVDSSCDPATGACASAPRPDGTICSDSSVCSDGDTCVAGTCVSGAPLDCSDGMSCTIDTCDAFAGCTSTPALTCEACDVSSCEACGVACDETRANYEAGCWSGFFSCLSGCTSTYCAPFCQVDLGVCLQNAPSVEACRAACDTGNGCDVACTGPTIINEVPPNVPTMSRLGFVALTALLAAGANHALLRRRRSARSA